MLGPKERQLLEHCVVQMRCDFPTESRAQTRDRGIQLFRFILGEAGKNIQPERRKRLRRRRRK